MNFAEKSGDPPKTRSLSVIKFRDNLRFSLDSRHLTAEVRRRAQGFKAHDSFYVLAKIVEINSGTVHEEAVILSFRGQFHEVVSGKVVMDIVYPKDFDKYSKTTPYLLSFLIDDLRPLTGKADVDVRR